LLTWFFFEGIDEFIFLNLFTTLPHSIIKVVLFARDEELWNEERDEQKEREREQEERKQREPFFLVGKKKKR